jgi:hypothetical protein
MYDPKHDYCAKCNMDFSDRTEYYIHRIMSNKHFMCPICTVEFRSGTGREIHIQNVSEALLLGKITANTPIFRTTSATRTLPARAARAVSSLLPI